MKELQDFTASSDMIDLPFHGTSFTWANRQRQGLWIEARLDRFFCSAEWIEKFPTLFVDHIEVSSSDHKALLLNFQQEFCYLKRPFRFEACWLLEPTFESVMQIEWFPYVPGSPSFSLHSKLSKLSKCLKSWNKLVVDNIHNRINHLRATLENLHNIPIQDRDEHWKQ
ncbi:uncharacterized protein LOC122073721 [Macadamia integrifolia]|uniref:uncharacterized protein LOC122073721 n=1 Tax=Macadamia integrifolia TaxID=60698 RepID=UPI001C4EB0D0|nr:uncharacterized protein LOC122073721 [Macadamia integrifolia]